MDQSKKKQQQMRNVSFGSLFDEKKMYPLKEAPYLITQMSPPKNTEVRLLSIFSLCYVPINFFALIRWLDNMAMEKI